MNVYNIHNIDMVHISEFALALNRSVQSTRHLIEEGNSVRKLKAFRDRSRLLIPTSEIYGYPFTGTGSRNKERGIFHYVALEGGRFEKRFCSECTFGEPCEARKAADAVNCPKGDA